MAQLLPIPNPSRVKEACEKFDFQHRILEEALSELFNRYHTNTNPSHVLLKVVALNRLYSAGVLAVEALASHIAENGAEIDQSLSRGAPTAVTKIACVGIREKEFRFFSFATKFCNWHKGELYPIYDSRVDGYLWSLQKHSAFSDFKRRSEICKDYPTFYKIMTDFRRHYGLESFTFKQIDKFLWSGAEFPAAQN